MCLPEPVMMRLPIQFHDDERFPWMALLKPNEDVIGHEFVGLPADARQENRWYLQRPTGCRLRVGNATREWQYGKALPSDAAIEHEGPNDSDDLRVVLILGVLNPLLSPVERAPLWGLVSSVREYRRAVD